MPLAVAPFAGDTDIAFGISSAIASRWIPAPLDSLPVVGGL
jgi:hypothetical protein